MLNIYHVVPSINDVKVHIDCCDKYYVTYKDKSTNTRCYLTYAEKTNYFVKPYSGKSFDEVITWYMSITHNVRLAEWARYKIEGPHADQAWVDGMRYWYNKWVNKYGHEMPALGCNPLEKSDEELLDYLVKLDLHCYSMIMPVVPANVPAGAKQWLGNIAMNWHNVQEFISRDVFQTKLEVDKREAKKNKQPAGASGTKGSGKGLSDRAGLVGPF